MLKKILAVLLVPTMMLGIFVGCGKKHTLLDVGKYYDRMVDKYSYDVEGDELTTKRSYIFAQSGETPGTSMHISYKGALGTGLSTIGSLYGVPADMDTELYNRYFALVNVEQKLLDWTYRYYTNWADKLYDSYKLIKDKIKQSDVENLYKKLEKLDNQIGKFIKEKSKAEDEINAISFEGAINLTTFTYAFNDLIEASLDFVMAFKDFHVKYVWDTYTFGDDKSINKLLLDRLIDEAYLNMATVIFYENVKAFEYAECDLNNIIQMANNGYKNQYVFINLLYSSVDKPCANINGAVYSNSNLAYYKSNDVVLAVADTDDEGNKIYETYNEALKNYVHYLKAFNQKINIYKSVYSKINFYKYNQVRLSLAANNDLNSYKASLSRLNSANLSLLENFTQTTFVNFVNSFTEIFV